MSIYAAASGMILEEKRQELIARNLVGSAMPGYKREFLTSHNFKTDLEEMQKENTNKFQGTSGGKEHINFGQGAVKCTGDPLDFAIHGDGFFEVETMDGKRLYTRNGQFSLNADGIVVTNNNEIVQGDAGPIQIPAGNTLDQLYVSAAGDVLIKEDDKETMLGKIKIVEPTDPSILKKINSTEFKLKDEKDLTKMVNVDTEQTGFAVMNCHLETSNATPITEMVSMIRSMREFEMGQKMLKSLDDMGKEMRRKLGG
jgi:flagellar basal-body rod protein FlgG